MNRIPRSFLLVLTATWIAFRPLCPLSGAARLPAEPGAPGIVVRTGPGNFPSMDAIPRHAEIGAPEARRTEATPRAKRVPGTPPIFSTILRPGRTTVFVSDPFLFLSHLGRPAPPRAS